MSLKELRQARKDARAGKQRAIGQPSIMEIANTRKHRYTRFSGPGTALEYIIYERYGAKACGGCLRTKAKMDKNGPQWCRENINDLAQELHENIEELRRTHKGGWIVLAEQMAYATTALHYHKQLINEGINLYETTTAVAENGISN